MSDIPTTVEFLSTVEGGKQESPFRLGVVTELFPNSTAKIKFDGEETASEKQYAYLASYMPALNDRVLLARTAGTYVILGKINYTESPTDPTESYFTVDGNKIKTNYNMEIQGWLGALNTVSGGNSLIVDLKVDGKLTHVGSSLGFFNHTPVGKQSCSTLSSSADLAAVVAKVREMISILWNYGLF
jgi:hypothetical protein